MKLPSPNPSKYFHSLLDEDDLGVVMDAEEYLVPQSLNAPGSSLPSSPDLDSSQVKLTVPYLCSLSLPLIFRHRIRSFPFCPFSTTS